MGAPKVDKAWVQARVTEYGGIDKSRPDDVALHAWREVCKALDVKARQTSPLERALKELAASAAA